MSTDQAKRHEVSAQTGVSITPEGITVYNLTDQCICVALKFALSPVSWGVVAPGGSIVLPCANVHYDVLGCSANHEGGVLNAAGQWNFNYHRYGVAFGEEVVFQRQNGS